MQTQSVVGKYRVLEELGRGSMGTVYLAEDTTLDRRIALKVMSLGALSDNEMRQRFEREAKAIARLHHPNIVTIYDLGYDGKGAPFFAMELLRGADLEQTLQDGLPSRKDAVQTLIQICSGLEHAHENDLVHRDIKPANVFITEEGVIKIMDFGVARWTQSSQTQPGSVIGTADYMSPEQVRAVNVDHRSDLFSAGVVLYRLLTNKKPFGADRIESVLFKILNDPLPELVLPDGSRIPALQKIVSRALAKSPAARYQSAKEMGAALEAFLRSDEDNSRAQPAKEDERDPQATMDQFKKRCGSTKDLPILRQTAVDVLRISDRSGAAEVSQVVLQDQAFTTKVLNVVNSVYFNTTSEPIHSVTRAVVILGLDLVRSISLGLGFAEMHEKQHPGVDLKVISAQAFYAATLARDLAKQLKHPHLEEVFVTALLQNLGQLAFAYHMPESHLEVQSLMEESGLSPQEAEETVLGTSLQEAGGSIAKEWNLPESLVDSIGVSESAVGSEAKTPAEKARAVSYLANKVAGNLFSASGNSEELDKVLDQLKRSVAIDPDRAMALFEKAHSNVMEVSAPFGLERDDFKLPDTLRASDSKSPSARSDLVSRLQDCFDSNPSEIPQESTPPSEPIEAEADLAPTEEEHQTATIEETMAFAPPPSDRAEAKAAQAPTEEEHPAAAVGETMAYSSPPANNATVETSQAALQLTFLREISMHVIANGDIDTLFLKVLEGVQVGIGFERAVLLLCNPDRTEFLGRYGIGAGSEDIASELVLPNDPKRNVFGKVYASQDSLFADNNAADFSELYSLLPAALKLNGQSAFAISPIVARGNVIGFIYADNAVEAKEMSEEQYLSFLVFTLQACLGVERLRA